MPRPHISMRKIREALRLSLGEGLSLRDVASSLQVPHTTVGDHVRRLPLASPGLPHAARSLRRTKDFSALGR